MKKSVFYQKFIYLIIIIYTHTYIYNIIVDQIITCIYYLLMFYIKRNHNHFWTLMHYFHEFSAKFPHLLVALHNFAN